MSRDAQRYRSKEVQWAGIEFYTVNDYYDGPRLGIAEVDGVPHIYDAEFDHRSDEYGDTYFVSPVYKSLLALVLEDREIWLR